ncbi:MAG TPA: immunoglobulin domain-containing protein [Chitinophagales bacterium]|nr:immunoglobulin domain-containing protein [Chitinophagales bacterium]
MKLNYFLSAVKKFFVAAALFFIAGTAGATIQTVTVENLVFTPSSFSINLGDTVKWVWLNGVHTTTSLGIPAGATSWNHDINSSAGNTVFIYVPVVVGTYNYWCAIHTSFMTGSFTVVCPTPSLTINAFGSTTFCSGGSVVLSKNSAANFSAYQWKRDGAVISGQTTTSTTATVAGSYTLVATNSCGNTGTSNAISVTVNTAPTAGQAAISAGGPTTFCSGGSVVLTVATAGLTYQWKNGGSTISGATLQSFTASATGAYTCDVSNSCGTTGSNSISVTVNTTAPTTAEAAISAGGATTFCSGGNVVLTVATAGLTYQWKNSGSTISGATLQSFTASATGSYSCDVSNTCGTTGSNSISVTVNIAPTAGEAAISAGGSTTFCSGGNVVLTVATAGLTYQWKNGGSAISGETNQSFTASATGSYTCDVSNSCGSTGSNSISVTVNTGPSAGEAAISAGGATTFCSGGNVVLTVATAGLTYQWKNGGSAISGETNQSFTASAAGSYTCDVSNSCGTTGSNSISVTVNTGPTTAEATISAGGSTTFCSGGSVVLSVATAGLTYQWKNGGSPISGATLQTRTASASGAYTCDVSNSCGTTPSNSITVTVNSAPTAAQAAITAGGPTAFCKGHNVVLTVATAGLTYQWKQGSRSIAGATLQSYTASKTYTYSCIVSNSCGSVTSNSISVTVNPAPTASISQAPCSGGAVLLTCTANPSSGVTYQWTKGHTSLSGATNSTYSATTGGTYKCTVTITATGCTKSSAGSSVTISCKLADEFAEHKVIVYPNPASDYFNINTSQLSAQSSLYIYDLTGRLVESHEVSGDEMQVGESLSNGVYFLKIESNHDTHQVIKLVKNF